MQSLLFDLSKAFYYIESSHKYFYPKRSIFLHACAPCYELPSTISTMGNIESISNYLLRKTGGEVLHSFQHNFIFWGRRVGGDIVIFYYFCYISSFNDLVSSCKNEPLFVQPLYFLKIFVVEHHL